MRADEPDSLEARIANCYASLSPQERRAADVLLAHAGEADRTIVPARLREIAAV